jgi:RNA polymerase sigma factor (sigma-70 family)
MADDPLSKDEQVELACGILERDQECLVRLLAIYGPRVKGLLRDRLGRVLTEGDVDSALSVAAAKAWNRIDDFDEKRGNLGGWFYTIAYNAAVDMVREGDGEPEGTLPLAREPEVPAHTPACLAEDPKDDPVVRDLLDEVSKLGATQRAIAEADLLAGGEADADQLAKKLGIPKQHIYSYRNKYLESLKARLAKRGHTEATVRSRR